MTLRQLLEQRDAAVTEMRSLATKAENEQRDLTETEASRFDSLKGDLVNFDRRIARTQALADAERSSPAIRWYWAAAPTHSKREPASSRLPASSPRSSARV